jgi:hypothetical protein
VWLFYAGRRKMSYDIRLVDSNGCTVILEKKHDFKGGTYMLGGNIHAEYNITYNYAPHFYRLMGEKGIRTIYGMTVTESLPILEKAASQLGREEDPDYWKPTQGNARKALLVLVALAKMVPPESKWDGD